MKLKVRIIGLWKRTNRRSKEDVHLILIDEQGSRIQAIIPSFFVHKFADKTKEYSVIIISKFSAEDHNDPWKMIRHPCIINFCYSTEVEQCGDCSISQMGIESANFNDILSGQLEPNTVVDIVGVISLVRDTTSVTISKQNKKKLKLEIELLDNEKNVLKCTLWEKYAEMLSTHINSLKDRRVVVILQFFKVNLFKENWEVSNSLFGSKIHFNQELPEIVAFLKSAAGEQNDSQVPSITHISNVNESIEEMYFKPSYLRSLEAIDSSCEIGHGVVVASVIDFDIKTTWYYHGCKVHACKVEELEGKFYCPKCKKDVLMPEPRYLIRIIVCDDNDDLLSLTLFDRFVKEYVGKSATTLLDQNPDSFPKDLDIFLNKEFLFKIEISDRNLKRQFKNTSSYQVKNMSADPMLIKQWRSLRDTNKDTVSDAHKEEHESSVCSTGSATPKKRSLEICSNDEIEPSETNCQESSTKLKRVKTEKNP